MCLDSIAPEVDKVNDSRSIYVGYKIFHKDKFSHLYPMYYNGNENTKNYRSRFPINRWVHDLSNDFLCTWNNVNVKYWTGFHLCQTIKDCHTIGYYQILSGISPDGSSYAIRKVQFSGVTVEGFQNGVRVIVARSIKILPLEKGDKNVS